MTLNLLLLNNSALFGKQESKRDRFNEPELEREIRFGLPEDFATTVLSDVLVDFSRLHKQFLVTVKWDN